jgi:hypothetical protein
MPAPSCEILTSSSSDDESRPPSALSLYSEASASTSVDSFELPEGDGATDAQYATYGRHWITDPKAPRSTLSFVTDAPLRLSRPPSRRMSALLPLPTAQEETATTAAVPRVRFLENPTRVWPESSGAVRGVLGLL